MQKRDLGLLVAGAALALDQGSKLFFLYSLGLASWATHCGEASARAFALLPFFNLRMVWNCGISLGLFQFHSESGKVFIATFVMIASGIVGWWLWSAKSRWAAAGLGLVLGGALGNLIDRLVYYGQVADFFEFHAFGYSFYVFNVADAAITIGACILLYEWLLKPEAPTVTGQEE